MRTGSRSVVRSLPIVDNFREFWTSGSDMGELRPNAKATPYPYLLLRQLASFPEPLGDEELVDLLVAYAQFTVAAEQRANGSAG